MNIIDMISYCEPMGENRCFSLPGALSVIPVRFSFPAPELNFTSWFTVFPRLHSEWQFVQEQADHFFISVAGMIRRAFRTTRKVFRCAIQVMNVSRTRTLKLAYAGRRL